MKNILTGNIASAISKETGLEEAQVAKLLEQPKNRQFGDLAFPCFLLAKTWKIPPQACAEKLAHAISSAKGSAAGLPQGVSEVKAHGPFLNFLFERNGFSVAITKQVLSTPTPAQTGKTVVIDYSSPNIAKPFHVGHLRATLIGNCLYRVYRHLGWNAVGVNHLGDWGTQFGFVWAGCQIWGMPEEPTVLKLVDLYRRATGLKASQQKEPTAEEAAYPDVNEIATNYFRDLEAGAQYAVDFWKLCVDISLAYLKATYKRLDVAFDHYTGESFYSDKLPEVDRELREANLLSESQGALGVDLGEQLGFARITTPDGRSLYLARDLATAKYRAETFNFDRSVYVVGAPQILHFQQLKAILNALGREYTDKIVHVPFGHVLGMKTRGEGDFIELNEFLDEAQERALQAYRSQVGKRPEGLDENEVARAVGLSALMFSNLSRTTIKDVHFDWDHALAFQGDSGPYLLYACARINGIKEKAAATGLRLDEGDLPDTLPEESAFQLASMLSEFEEVTLRTAEEFEPAYLTSYALELAKAFSKAYLDLKVVGEDPHKAKSRLLLFEATRRVLADTLHLLGITPLERM